MAFALKKYKTRPPRYDFRASDAKNIRFAKPDGKGAAQSFTTNTLLDISQTGIAFIIDESISLKKGDSLMVEFTVPGSEKMACHASVVRVEDDPTFPSERIIGIQFKDLLPAHRSNLTQGLKRCFMHLRALQQRDQLIQKFHQKAKRTKPKAIWLIYLLFAVITFYFVLQPRGL